MDEDQLRQSVLDLTERLRVQQERLDAQQALIETHAAQQQHRILANPIEVQSTPPLPTTQGGNPVVAKIGVHLPPFSASDPQLWFAIADNSFRAAGITTEETKYQYVVAHLGHENSREVKDLIINTPAVNPFSTLREAVTLRVGQSQKQKTRRLLELEQLGDRKASQFLRHLKDLGGSLVNDEFLKTIWLTRLPTMVQAILAGQQNLSLDNLASLADSIMETTSCQQLAQITKSPTEYDSAKPFLPSMSPIETLMSQMQLMQREIASLKSFSGSGRGTSRNSRSPNRSRDQRGSAKSPDRSLSRKRSGLCWYHWRWGSGATKCIPPCNFADFASGASGPSTTDQSLN